jgi:hypothetical protein
MEFMLSMLAGESWQRWLQAPGHSSFQISNLKSFQALPL